MIGRKCVIVRNLSFSTPIEFERIHTLRVTELTNYRMLNFLPGKKREAVGKFSVALSLPRSNHVEIIFDDFVSRFRGSIFPGFLVSGRFTVFRSTSIRFSSWNMPGASASCQLLRRWITIFKYSTFFVRKYGDGRCQPHPRCPDIYVISPRS